ncbi:MAG: FMN-binding protein, partial [Microbacteriaceae bacterium]|nr:FMN-binding protein [Microbacteriaceae bacterium]
SSGSSSAGSAVASGAGFTNGTYTGTAKTTRYGTVQVRVTISGGAITDVATVVLSGNEGRSNQINNSAAPVLRSEVLASQSAKVATVSGATYTSDAYLSSLQSALDQA